MEKRANMAKLITDTADVHYDSFKMIHESLDKESKAQAIILEGVYAQADCVNGNNRVYPYAELKEEIDRFNEEMVKTKRALGNLEHPDYAEIKPQDAAIRILSLKEDNKSWIGRSVVLASDPKHDITGTPNGDILKGILQYGTKMGFSTRSLGNVDESTGTVTDLQLCTIDCVANPSIGQFCSSNGDRFINGILESKEFVINIHGEKTDKAYTVLEKGLANIGTKQNIMEERKAQAISNFFKMLHS